jgi:hypothetical protein
MSFKTIKCNNNNNNNNNMMMMMMKKKKKIVAVDGEKATWKMGKSTNGKKVADPI